EANMSRLVRALMAAAALALPALAAVGRQAPAEPARRDLHGDPLPPGASAPPGPLRFRQGGGTAPLPFPPAAQAGATGGTRTLSLWETDTGKELHRLEPFWGEAVAFSPDGKVIAAGDPDRGLRLWDAATGRQIARWPEAARRFAALAFSPDGRTLAVA